jgi:hypothetical protein
VTPVIGFPDAMQHLSGAPLIRDRIKREFVAIPGLRHTISHARTAQKRDGHKFIYGILRFRTRIEYEDQTL